MRRTLWAIPLLFVFHPASAETPSRTPATVVADYDGAHPETFTAELDRVRTLVHVAPVEVSARLGLLQYRDGFRYPLVVRFQDGAPPGLENALAFVAFQHRGEEVRQVLNINVAALAADQSDFDTTFYHEMTHAVLNDAVGGDAGEKIPRWVQEGLALWASGDAEARVKDAARQVRRSKVSILVVDIDGPATAQAYPQFALAILYFLDTGGINAVQTFVRDLLAGQDVNSALQQSLNMDLPTFKKNLAAYSLKVFQDNAPPD